MYEKSIKIIVIIILLIIVGYLGYKAFNLFKYDIMNEDIFNLEIVDSINVNYDKKLDNNQEYLGFKNIKIRNDFKNFKFLADVSTDNDLKFRLDDENGNRKAAIMIGVAPTYIKILNSDIDVFSYDYTNIADDDLNNIKETLDENNISSDINLFKYIIEHKADKNNIFTSVNKLRDDYNFYYLLNIMLPNNKGITLINGTYSGYIFELNNGIKEVNILYDDNRYIFTFIGDEYFNDEYIYELLETIVIDDLNEIIFTRTYNIIDKFENNSVEYDSFKIKQYQNDDIVIVDIKEELSVNIEKGKNYEFTFKLEEDIDDDIKSIFDNCELVDVVETNKVGLEQKQDKIK